MKSWFKRIGLFFLIITAVVILFLKVAPTVLLGRWLFDLFGLISYEPPLSQHTQSIVQVDLLDTSDQELTVLYSITGEEIDQFVDDFMQIEAGRFANDPILEYGDRMIRICYSDGGYDLHGVYWPWIRIELKRKLKRKSINFCVPEHIFRLAGR